MRIACHWLRLYIVYLRHPLYSWQQSDTGVWYYLIYKEVMEGVSYQYVLLILLNSKANILPLVQVVLNKSPQPTY